MANLLCPGCGCPIAVDRGLRWRGVMYCCRGCATGGRCERPGCRQRAVGAEQLPDVALPETRARVR